MTFTRYAIYFAPPAEAAWTRFATSWLGWDAEAGQTVPQPDISGVDVAAATQVPRKYGLHATMKPPFALAQGKTVSGLHEACVRLAQTQPVVSLEGLALVRLGRFLALRPKGCERALNALAAACVRELDAFRAPPLPDELERRRAAGLTPVQEANLTQWGYPHVMEAFRFHITLSGKLGKPALSAVQATLDTQLVPLLPAPCPITDLALMGEAQDGRFHLIQRYALTG